MKKSHLTISNYERMVGETFCDSLFRCSRVNIFDDRYEFHFNQSLKNVTVLIDVERDAKGRKDNKYYFSVNHSDCNWIFSADEFSINHAKKIFEEILIEIRKNHIILT